MDPITVALNTLVADVTAALQDPAVRAVLVNASLEDAGMAAKALRAAEWDAENRSPFLIFEEACADPGAALLALAAGVRGHFDLVRAGLAEEGVELAPLRPAPAGVAPEVALQDALGAFTAGVVPTLKPPVFCWLPANVSSDPTWTDTAITVLRLLWATPVRGVLLAPTDGTLLQRFDRTTPALRVVPFAVDTAATQDHFAQLLGPPPAGRGPGALPGAAAPDVAPPPRLRPPPSPQQTRAALDSAGIKGVLTPDEAERLRTCAVEAATAASKGDAARALARQADACALCAAAGANVELVLMSMLAASYQLQFGRPEDAIASYQHAERVAADAGAYPQLTQARLGLAYVWFSREQLVEAIAVYEQAVLAALLGGVNLLAFEALRLLGTCHQRLGRTREAAYCWGTALRHARHFSPDEVRVSTFNDVASSLTALYRQLGQEQPAAAVQALVQQVGAAAREVEA